MHAELELIRDGRTVQTVHVRGRMVLGRSASSDLVLVDDDVSKHHAVLVLDGGVLTVTDLRSTNGTFVNDEPLVGERALRVGDVVRLGPVAALRVRRTPRPSDRMLPLVHDLAAGIRYAFDADRLSIGSAADDAIRLPGPPRAATLLIDADGEVWLGIDGDEVPLEAGVPFEVGGRRLVLEVADAARGPTLKNAVRTRYPYKLRAMLDGPGGAVATFTRLDRDVVHQITSENRAVLLYLLARKLASDRQAGAEEIGAGWCDDAEVVVGVWGRAANDQAPSALNVLVHRIRKELEEAGFDPWCIEKRRGAIRIRVDSVEVAG